MTIPRRGSSRTVAVLDDAAGLHEISFIRVPRRKLRVEEYSQRGSNRRAGRSEGSLSRDWNRRRLHNGKAIWDSCLTIRPSAVVARSRSFVASIDFIARAAIELPRSCSVPVSARRREDVHGHGTQDDSHSISLSLLRACLALMFAALSISRLGPGESHRRMGRPVSRGPDRSCPRARLGRLSGAADQRVRARAYADTWDISRGSLLRAPVPAVLPFPHLSRPAPAPTVGGNRIRHAGSDRDQAKLIGHATQRRTI